jgi:hypothetical protein
MDFLDWNKIRLIVLNESKMSLQPEIIEECKKIKQGMTKSINDSRTFLNRDHLKRLK